MTTNEDKAGKWKSWVGFIPLLLCLVLIFLVRSNGQKQKEASLPETAQQNLDLSGELSDQQVVDLVSKKGKLSDSKANRDSSKEQVNPRSPLAVREKQRLAGEGGRRDSVESRRENNEGELSVASQINSPTGGLSNEVSSDDTPASQLELSSPAGLLNQSTEGPGSEPSFVEPVEIQLQDGELVITEKGSAVERLFEALKLDIIGESFALGRVGFQPDSANLSDGSKIQVRNLARILNDYPAFKVEISLPTGTNPKIAQQRAEQIRGMLMSEGVESSRLRSRVTKDLSSTEAQPSLTLKR